MNREDILAMSRKENKNMDERERDALAKAGAKATAVGGLVCAFIIVMEAIFSDHVSLTAWAVYLAMTGTTFLVKYTELKRKHELVLGIVQFLMAIAFLILFVIGLVG